MKIHLIVTIILSTLFLLNCAKENVATNSKENTENLNIVYGTSFGMCVGQCRKEINIKNDNVIFTFYTTEGRGAVGGTPQSFEENLKPDFYKSIIESIDYEVFMKLDEFIGCPDCADGGAEYIEIIKGEFKHKVTFEYGKTPESIKNLVIVLKEKKTYFEDKYLK